MSFIYFKCLPELNSFIKKEVQIRLPEAKFSFSAPGFLTFKMERLKEFKSCQSWAYALEWGVCHQLFKNDQAMPSPLRGQYFQVSDINGADLEPQAPSAFVFQHQETPRDDIPSRTYFKMAQAHEWLGLPDILPDEELVLELGSAPGGTAFFWIERGQRVIGVDPGEMDERVLKSENFRHIKRGVQYLKTIDFTTFEKEKVSLITVDMNLSAFLSLKETLNVSEMFPALRTILLTLKTPRTSDVEKLAGFLRKVEKAGFSYVSFRSLLAHKKETLLIARR